MIGGLRWPLILKQTAQKIVLDGAHSLPGTYNSTKGTTKSSRFTAQWITDYYFYKNSFVSCRSFFFYKRMFFVNIGGRGGGARVPSAPPLDPSQGILKLRLTKEICKKLDTFQTKCLPRFRWIFLMEKFRNEKLFKYCNIEHVSTYMLKEGWDDRDSLGQVLWMPNNNLQKWQIGRASCRERV